MSRLRNARRERDRQDLLPVRRQAADPRQRRRCGHAVQRNGLITGERSEGAGEHQRRLVRPALLDCSQRREVERGERARR